MKRWLRKLTTEQRRKGEGGSKEVLTKNENLRDKVRKESKMGKIRDDRGTI